MTNLPRSDSGSKKVSDDTMLSVSLFDQGYVTGNQTSPALCDKYAWGVLRQFLTTDMTMPEMDDALTSYLGDRYFADDWVEPRRVLFSGEGDDAESLANLDRLMAMHVPPDPPSPTSNDTSVSMSTSRTDGCLSSSRRKRSRVPKVSEIPLLRMVYTKEETQSIHNPYIVIEASEDEDEDDEGGDFERSQIAIHVSGPSAKERLAKRFDDLASKFEENSSHSSQGRRALTSKAASIPSSLTNVLAPENKMYLLDIQSMFILHHLAYRSLYHRNCYRIHCRTPSEPKVFRYLIDLGSRATLCSRR